MQTTAISIPAAWVCHMALLYKHFRTDQCRVLGGDFWEPKVTQGRGPNFPHRFDAAFTKLLGYYLLLWLLLRNEF